MLLSIWLAWRGDRRKRRRKAAQVILAVLTGIQVFLPSTNPWISELTERTGTLRPRSLSENSL
jgi:hypothetical protein